MICTSMKLFEPLIPNFADFSILEAANLLITLTTLKYFLSVALFRICSRSQSTNYIKAKMRNSFKFGCRSEFAGNIEDWEA